MPDYYFDTTSTVTAWSGWANSTTASTVQVVWVNWSDTTTGSAGTYAPAYRADDWTHEAAEEVESRQAAWQEASARARTLLGEHLTRRQRRQLREHHHFDVRGSRGGVYRICRGQVQNVLELDDAGRAVARLCGHPQRDRVPDEDAMLAQKLMLETDEESFRRIANRSAA